MREIFLPAAAMAAIAMTLAGCEPTPPPPPKLAVTPTPVVAPSTQPDEVVAALSTLTITRRDLDALLYEAYGLRMLFDLVELDLAKDTLHTRGLTITPEEIQHERESVIKGIVGPDAPESRYEDLFNQFLQNEHLSRAEFDVKIVRTDAVLRKIVTPLVVGKLPETVIHQGFEQMYGAKRQIADVELENVREAARARDRLNKGERFRDVANSMSIDTEAAKLGGMWQAFSVQSGWVPQAIRDAAFTLAKGQISDILQADGKYHIIQVVDLIPPDPKIAKYEDHKADVQKQLEDRLITFNMKKLREDLTLKAQQELRFDDPILKAQWDALVQQQLAKQSGRESALKKLNEDNAHSTTEPATQP